jgi:hypothetical protein
MVGSKIWTAAEDMDVFGLELNTNFLPFVFKCISLIEAVCAGCDGPIGKCISLIDAVYQFPSVFALDVM